MFWSIFQVIEGHHNSSGPYDFPSWLAWKGHNTFESLTFDEIHTLLVTSTKFMFVREPYARLFSGYVDKLFLPNVKEHAPPLARAGVGRGVEGCVTGDHRNWAAGMGRSAAACSC